MTIESPAHVAVLDAQAPSERIPAARIDYRSAAEKYRPVIVTTLLIAEAPPASGKTYFYVPCALNCSRSIEDDTSLPATIFHHYFGKRPRNTAEYETLLSRLCTMGVFLTDICDEPIRVRHSVAGLERILEELPTLRNRLHARGLDIPEERIIFLLARRNYLTHVRREFPIATCVTWKDFRLRTDR